MIYDIFPDILFIYENAAAYLTLFMGSQNHKIHFCRGSHQYVLMRIYPQGSLYLGSGAVTGLDISLKICTDSYQ